MELTKDIRQRNNANPAAMMPTPATIMRWPKVQTVRRDTHLVRKCLSGPLVRPASSHTKTSPLETVESVHNGSIERNRTAACA